MSKKCPNCGAEADARKPCPNCGYMVPQSNTWPIVLVVVGVVFASVGSCCAVMGLNERSPDGRAISYSVALWFMIPAVVLFVVAWKGFRR